MFFIDGGTLARLDQAGRDLSRDQPSGLHLTATVWLGNE